MTGYDDLEQSLDAAMAGAAAYCSKDAEPTRLVQIIRDVADGKFVFGSRSMCGPELQTWVAAQIERQPASYSEPGSPFHPLSKREMEVLECVVRGLSNKEISALPRIIRQTVKNHVTSILWRFSVEDSDAGGGLRSQARVGASEHFGPRIRGLNRTQPSKRLSLGECRARTLHSPVSRVVCRRQPRYWHTRALRRRGRAGQRPQAQASPHYSPKSAEPAPWSDSRRRSAAVTLNSSAMAAMCSGVVPQQPPTTRAPSRIACAANSAMSPGATS